MCDLKICRICLRTMCKFYKYDQLPLKFYYEELMTFKSKGKDILPQYFCYECATMLHKFHKFKEKCYNGQNTLQDLIFKNKLNYNEVHKIYKKRKSQPPFILNLSIIKVSKQVKTFIYKYDGDEEWENEIEIDIINKHCLGNDHDLDEKCQDDTRELNFDNSIDVKNEKESVSNNVQTTHETKSNFDQNNHEFDDNALFDNIPNLNDDRIETEKVPEHNLHKSETHIPSPISSDDEVLARKVRNKLKNRKLHLEPVKKVPKFQRSKNGPPKLSDGNWKKINLTDDEAMQRFEAKGVDSKYVNAPFKCTQCYRWFSNVDIYDRHMVLRHNQSLRLECRFCKMRFKLGHQLQKHMKQHYNVFECQRCYFVCPLEQSAIFHDESHNGKIRTCNVCYKEFTHSSTYYSHMTTHRTNFVCTLCGRSFVSELGLDVHKKRTHVNYLNENTAKIDTETIYCERCDIKFEARAAYEEHVFHSANHTEDIVDPNNELLRFQKKVCGIKEKAVLAEEIRIRREQDPTLVLTKPMKRACVRVSKKTPMNCYQCGKHFESQMQCRKHHLKEHPRTTFVCPGTPERTICEICGADLAFSSMMAHLNMHSREKLYKCDLCDRSFVQNSTLKRHMLTHTGERPYPCTLCGKRFTQSNSQQLHYRTVHLKEPHPKRNRRKKVEEHLNEDD
ncbi:zinc finger protein 37-like isoform X2 [Plodia interpunctella]|uniref:zinc finger protein 37-like isoform X2 n=1 Tax=Plodia interpunctella TaxID=58824 RepID=UPI002367795D|nr:zinc finger protein 37-like isoform X2 [Plodia interpunctella]